MTIRIPYEIVAAGAEKILWEALLNNTDLIEAYERFINYIEACGWTNRDYDAETLKRVDADWDNLSKSN